MTPYEIDLAWVASPPETSGAPTLDGAVFRVALNIPNGREDFLAVYPLIRFRPGYPSILFQRGLHPTRVLEPPRQRLTCLRSRESTGRLSMWFPSQGRCC